MAQQYPSPEYDEFDLISRFFAPLSRGAPGAYNLTDDVALSPAAPHGLILSCDSLVEGVHFLPGDPLDSVARKLLRRNLSDIVAKGARPLGYLLALVWPRSRPVEQIAQFALGLGEDQDLYGFSLWGGDTTRTDGPLTASITIVGEAIGRGPVRRAGAAPGDEVFVTGTIGDAALGLMAASGQLSGISEKDSRWLIGRYRLPQPRIAAARLVANFATAAIDISDGLVADAQHLASVSGMRVEIDATLTPLSDAGARWFALQPDGGAAWRRLLSGGDDYEVLFCAAAARSQDVFESAKRDGLQLTRIGVVTRGAGVGVSGPDRMPLNLPITGWRHF